MRGCQLGNTAWSGCHQCCTCCTVRCSEICRNAPPQRACSATTKNSVFACPIIKATTYLLASLFKSAAASALPKVNNQPGPSSPVTHSLLDPPINAAEAGASILIARAQRPSSLAGTAGSSCASAGCPPAATHSLTRAAVCAEVPLAGSASAARQPLRTCATRLTHICTCVG